jgi:hypothetical protein
MRGKAIIWGLLVDDFGKSLSWRLAFDPVLWARNDVVPTLADLMPRRNMRMPSWLWAGWLGSKALADVQVFLLSFASFQSDISALLI